MVIENLPNSEVLGYRSIRTHDIHNRRSPSDRIQGGGIIQENFFG